MEITQLYFSAWKRQAYIRIPEYNPIDQQDALQGQIEGMTDTPFSYEDYETIRKEMIAKRNQIFTKKEKEWGHRESFTIAEIYTFLQCFKIRFSPKFSFK